MTAVELNLCQRLFRCRRGMRRVFTSENLALAIYADDAVYECSAIFGSRCMGFGMDDLHRRMGDREWMEREWKLPPARAR